MPQMQRNRKIRYFSAFAGIGGFEAAIQRVFPGAVCVGYSEIDPGAIKIYEKHYPKHKNFGDITKIKLSDLPHFDLLVGGSPCQDLSRAKMNREGLKGSRSSLFYTYAKILSWGMSAKNRPTKYFLLENVASMMRPERDEISRVLEVEPVMVDAALVSAQQRARLFWANFPITQPKDKGILLKDILESGHTERDKSYHIGASYNNWSVKNYFGTRRRQLVFLKPVRVELLPGRVKIFHVGGERIAIEDFKKLAKYVRTLTITEIERLQGFKKGYTSGSPKTTSITGLGNAVNVDVIAHIMSCLKKTIR